MLPVFYFLYFVYYTPHAYRNTYPSRVSCLLQKKLGNQYPVGRIPDSFRKYGCTTLNTNYYKFIYYDEIIIAQKHQG